MLHDAPKPLVDFGQFPNESVIVLDEQHKRALQGCWSAEVTITDRLGQRLDLPAQLAPHIHRVETVLGGEKPLLNFALLHLELHSCLLGFLTQDLGVNAQ